MVFFMDFLAVTKKSSSLCATLTLHPPRISACFLMLGLLTACDSEPRPKALDQTDLSKELKRIEAITSREVDLRLDRRFEIAVGIRFGEAPPDDRFNCSGTLLSPEWVLTTDHCILARTSLTVTVPRTHVMEDGREFRLTSSTEGQAIAADFAKGFLETHEVDGGDQRPSVLSDLALIHLSEPATQIDSAYPVIPVFAEDRIAPIVLLSFAELVSYVSDERNFDIEEPLRFDPDGFSETVTYEDVRDAYIEDLRHYDIPESPHFASAGFGKIDTSINDVFRYTRHHAWYYAPSISDVFTLIPTVQTNSVKTTTYCPGDNGAPVMLQDGKDALLLGAYVQTSFWLLNEGDVLPPCEDRHGHKTAADIMDVAQYTDEILALISDYECSIGTGKPSSTIKLARGGAKDFAQMLRSPTEDISTFLSLEDYIANAHCRTPDQIDRLNNLDPYIFPRESVPPYAEEYAHRKYGHRNSFFRPQHPLKRRANCRINAPLQVYTSYIDGLKRKKIASDTNASETIVGLVGDVDQIIRNGKSTNWYVLYESYEATINTKDDQRIGFVHDVTSDNVVCD